MAWNKLVLNGTEQEIPLGFDAWVLGTGAAETLTLAAGINSLLAAGDNDQINLSGSIDDYIISMSGSQLLLEAGDGTTTTVNVGGTSQIGFAEGLVDLSLSFGAQGPQMNLGNAVITDGQTLTDNADSVYGITGPVDIQMADLDGIDQTAPFDAESGDFIFHLDSSEDFETWITGFDQGDAMHFFNTPTGSPEDFNVTNAPFDDGEAVVGVGAVAVNLLGLSNDFFNNADTFTNIYGLDALAFA